MSSEKSRRLHTGEGGAAAVLERPADERTAHDAADPRRAAGGSEDPLTAWDAARRRCPVARDRDERGELWVVHGHPEALAVLHDHQTFSSRVSAHLSVPSGMDPPEHTAYRAIVERYFGPAEVAAFEPACRRTAAEIVEAAVARGGCEVQAEIGEPCAVAWQCDFMGWPPATRRTLTEWQDANERATRAGDKAATAAVAAAFEREVVALFDERRTAGDAAPDDPTTRLLAERLDGRPLDDAEIVSIVRNWTVGELGSIAAGIGILVHALASDPELQARLRREPARVAAAADEVLRVRGPLVANRRVATRQVELGGELIAAGERVRLLWPSIDRDERVFAAPGEVRLDRDPADNLLYGAGIHVCPGAPLARLELRVFLAELLARTSEVTLDPARPPLFAAPPQGGYERLQVRLAR